LISVDLPDPEGPQTTMTSPFLDRGRAIRQHLEGAVPFRDFVDGNHGHGLTL
jgi:hypothetical protein